MKYSHFSNLGRRRKVLSQQVHCDGFAVAIDVETGEGRDQVIRGIVERFREIADVLSVLPPREEMDEEKGEEEEVEE